MIFLVLALLCAAEHPKCWGDTSDFRSSTTKYHFFKEHPCPGGPDQGSLHRCRGYVIDHICPLECCGKDDPANMQWQTIEEGKAKDKWEGDCARSCALPKKASLEVKKKTTRCVVNMFGPIRGCALS